MRTGLNPLFGRGMDDRERANTALIRTIVMPVFSYGRTH